MNKLQKWAVAQEETALTGAASAFLSISDLGLVLDSPLWCSALTARKIGMYRSSWCKRIYSTLIEENDLVFGAKKKIISTTKKMMEEFDYSAIGVALNCGPALMGDDVEGICGSITDAPVIVTDAGGFYGEADQSWSMTMISLLEKTSTFSKQRHDEQINLLGCAIYDVGNREYPNNYGSYKVKYIPGYREMRFAEIAKLSESALNLVCHSRGLAMAEWMEEHCKQPYEICY